MNISRKLIIAVFLAVTAGVNAQTAVQDYQTGLQLYQQGQYAQSIEAFQKALDQHPQLWQAYQAMGNAYYKDGRNAEALGAFKKSVELNPDNEKLKTFIKQVEVTRSNQSEPSSSKKESDQKEGRLDRPHFFFRYSLGAGFALLDDVNGGVKAWDVNNFAGSYSEKNLATLKQNIELGYSLDKNNGLSAEFGNFVSPGGMFLHANWGFDGPVTIGPDSYENFYNSIDMGQTNYVGLNYYYFLPDEAGRWFASIGPRYFFTMHVNLYSDWTVNSTEEYLSTSSQGFKGMGFGVAVSLGRQIPLLDFMGLAGLIELRYANIPKVTGESPSIPGVTSTIAKSPDGSIGIVPESAIGAGGLEYVTFDLSGVEARLGLEFYI